MPKQMTQTEFMMHKYRGFGIVELMIAMLISLILLGGVAQIFLASKKSYTIQTTLSRQQENGRYVIDILSNDLRRKARK